MNVLPAPSAPPHLTLLKYRADIDGLRAIAVLSVVGFHAFPDWMPGGFTGVDIFFVISGFLISGIIIGNLEKGSFSFSEFYARRIRRIFPALILVMIACYALGWVVLLPDEYKQLGKHIAAGAGFVSNLFFWQESGYFDHAAQVKPLLHLWSLGIEEQFYIVWPLSVYLIFKCRLNFFRIAIALLAISFAFSIKSSYSDLSQAFYSPAARFWELLTGSILATLALHKTSLLVQVDQGIVNLRGRAVPKRFSQNILNNLISLSGACLICGTWFLVTRDTTFPGWAVLLPVVGTNCVIFAGPHAWLNRTILSNRILVALGLISYPLYLWHWPLLSFARIIEGAAPAPEIRAMVVAASIVLAWLTYLFLEKPVRFGPSGPVKTLALLLIMSGVGVTGYVTYRQDGLEFRLLNLVKISRAAGEWEYPGNLKSFNYQGKHFLEQKSGLENTTLFIGDSNIEQYYPRIDELIKRKPGTTNSVIFSTGEGCVPIPQTTIPSYKYCADLLKTSLELALSRKDISTVVIGGLWYQYLSGEAISGEALSYYFSGDGQQYPVEMGSAGYQMALTALSKYIATLKRGHKQVMLVLNIPMGSELDPFYMVHRELNHFPDIFTIRDGGINLNDFEEKYGYIKNDLIRIANKNKIEFIDPVSFLCGNALCSSVDNDGEPLYKDGQHLRPGFVRNKATFIDVTVSNRAN